MDSRESLKISPEVQGQLSDRTGIQVSNIQAKKQKHIHMYVCKSIVYQEGSIFRQNIDEYVYV